MEKQEETLKVLSYISSLVVKDKDLPTPKRDEYTINFDIYEDPKIPFVKKKKILTTTTNNLG